ncbi:MAG TPA: DNA polymerase III subunit alpha, partial [Candidatus Paceibacterota bacterium]|nr:DNA polymerase III subunit alpha [Candidatus Paceibacterota bacterium]
SRFTHLHTHSHYSLLQALPKIPDLVAAAKDGGFSALALTDNGNLYGAIEFYKECKDKGIKPIIGVDFYVAPRTRNDKQAGIDARRTRLVLLAKDYAGYKNIIQLVTHSYLEGFYYKPRIDKELIEKYRDGLVAIVPAMNSEITMALQGNDIEKSTDVLKWYKKIFGDDVYMEITQHPDIDNHEEMMKRAVSSARNAGIPLVAGQEVYYLKPEDKIAQRTMMLVSSTGGEVDRSQLEEDGDFSFISADQADVRFRDMPEAIENNAKIVEKCNLEIKLGNWVFPKFELPKDVTPDDELHRIAFEGFARRGIQKTDEAVKRVEYELSVIKNKGYAPYFLIVADLLRFAREKNIFSNIRGSVSGSMATYLAGITNINPLEFEIPFERFLNPDRPSAPDIDMDFADDRRDEIIDYAREKYGKDKVAQIGTFGTMAARGSVRDITRALGFPVEFGDKLAKMIPIGSQGFPMTIDRALEMVTDLKKLYDTDADTKRVIDLAKKIEGCARHISVHAAGVVIAPTELTDFTALQYDTKGENKIITQYDMYSIEEAGLLKFDFLGLKNLTILSESVRFVKVIYGKIIDIEKIPFDNKKTFELLAKGETAGLFQLNGEGMTKFLKDLKPTTIHDINAMVALYRPGPIQFIPEYIARKHDPKKISYLDPALKPILEKTYGILVYQDDLLMMAHNLAGYSWGEVDKFRKAVGKKIPKEMAEQKEKFIEGCIKTSGWSKKKAEEIWGWIEPFAAYGFNKAHSVSYGKVAYQTA